MHESLQSRTREFHFRLAPLEAADPIIKDGRRCKGIVEGDPVGSLEPDLGKVQHWLEEIRGKGLLIGIQLDRGGGGVLERCEKRGLLINCTASTVIRLAPPLTVTEDEIHQAFEILHDELLQEKDPPPPQA